MVLIHNLFGLVFLLSVYFVADYLLKNNKYLSFLYIYLIIYFEITFVSLFNLLNVNVLFAFSFLHFYFLYKKKYFENFEFRIPKVSYSYLFIYIICLPYLLLMEYTGFNFDDVLTTYLPRVNQWIQAGSIFVNLDLFDYYNPILLYPQTAQLPLLIIQIFKFPVVFYFIFSFYTINQILHTFKIFYKLDKNEYVIVKFGLFFSPIILILSTSGLNDLFYAYFFVLAFLNLIKYIEHKENYNLNISLLATCFAISVRYHGFFILFIVGLVLLQTKNISTWLRSAKYTIFYFLLFNIPNLIWLYLNGTFERFTSTFLSQFGTSKSTSIEFGNNPTLELLLFNNTGLLKRLINIYDSIVHTTVNYTFTDFPGVMFLENSENILSPPLYRFNVFMKSADVRTTGTLIFIISFLYLLSFVIDFFIKNQTQSKILKFFIIIFKVNLVLAYAVSNYIFIGKKNLIFVLIINFVLVTALFLHKNISTQKDISIKSRNLYIFIFSVYFLLISLRDFSDTNLRYLFPLFILIFPLGVKNFSKFFSNKLVKVLFVSFSALGALQAIAMSEMLLQNPYPELQISNESSNKSLRGWYPLEYRDNVDKTVEITSNIIKLKDNQNIVIAIEQKFPIALFHYQNSYFINNLTDSIIDQVFFDEYNSKILITDQKDLNYDSETVSYIDSNEIYEITEIKNYIIIFFNNSSYFDCRQLSNCTNHKK